MKYISTSAQVFTGEAEAINAFASSLRQCLQGVFLDFHIYSADPPSSQFGNITKAELRAGDLTIHIGLQHTESFQGLVDADILAVFDKHEIAHIAALFGMHKLVFVSESGVSQKPRPLIPASSWVMLEEPGSINCTAISFRFNVPETRRRTFMRPQPTLFLGDSTDRLITFNMCRNCGNGLNMVGQPLADDTLFHDQNPDQLPAGLFQFMCWEEGCANHNRQAMFKDTRGGVMVSTACQCENGSILAYAFFCGVSLTQPYYEKCSARSTPVMPQETLPRLQHAMLSFNYTLGDYADDVLVVLASNYWDNGRWQITNQDPEEVRRQSPPTPTPTPRDRV